MTCPVVALPVYDVLDGQLISPGMGNVAISREYAKVKIKIPKFGLLAFDFRCGPGLCNDRRVSKASLTTRLSANRACVLTDPFQPLQSICIHGTRQSAAQLLLQRVSAAALFLQSATNAHAESSLRERVLCLL